MRILSRLGVMGTMGLLCAAGMVAVAGSASAAPPSSEVFSAQVSLADGSATSDVVWRSRGNVQAGPGKPMVMAGRTKAGLDTVITCYVYGSGPASNGSIVSFALAIDCVGGVPRQLFVHMDIARYLSSGAYVIEPSSVTDCIENFQPSLLCYSETRCFQAGAAYDAYARLFGVDENGILHESAYYASPRWLGCTI